MRNPPSFLAVVAEAATSEPNIAREPWVLHLPLVKRLALFHFRLWIRLHFQRDSNDASRRGVRSSPLDQCWTDAFKRLPSARAMDTRNRDAKP